MPVSSLPSKYGIGNFGAGAYDFIDFLAKTKQKCWQVLPLNPTSYGDSPYQSPASVAGNPYFLDPELLARDGLLTKEELASAENSSDTVDYGWLFNTRYELLRCAHKRFSPDADYRRFCKKNADWLEDYALFMALKVANGFRAWYEWDEEYKNASLARAHAEEHRSEMCFWSFVQYEFFKQWQGVLDYAHKRKISIIGDMPIYVAHDSMDVWRAPEQFLLDGDHMPTEVAGCPPDGFSPDGQLWGNPIYNWDKMKSDGYLWWCDRVKKSFALYDILRIDHFRGFAGYYHIPYGDATARNGEWSSAPGIELFRTISEKFPKAKIIAEDLGFITPDVRELLSATGFPGMKILQFAFFDEGSEYLPKNYTTQNCVVYSGSHDSDCTRTWCDELEGEVKARFVRECPRRKYQSRTYALIELALSSIANLAVIPMQDYLELTNNEGRMNTPSIPEGNWCWRIRDGYRTRALAKKITDLAVRTKRNT